MSAKSRQTPETAPKAEMNRFREQMLQGMNRPFWERIHNKHSARVTRAEQLFRVRDCNAERQLEAQGRRHLGLNAPRSN